MSELVFKKEFSFLQSQDKILYSGGLQPYRAPYIILIFVVAIVVLCLDMVFLGFGLIGAVFNNFRWLAVVLFVVKIIVDVTVFALWYALIVEKSNKDKFSYLYLTEQEVIIACHVSGEISFIKIPKVNCGFVVRQNLLNKFCQVFTLEISYLRQVKKIRLLAEEREKLEQVLFN